MAVLAQLQHTSRTQLIRQALTFQQQLEDAVQVVARLSSSTLTAGTLQSQKAELQRVSGELTTSSAGLQNFFSGFASTSLYNERRPDAASPARRAFDIPEVLEHIISYLKASEILRAMDVPK